MGCPQHGELLILGIESVKPLWHQVPGPAPQAAHADLDFLKAHVKTLGSVAFSRVDPLQVLSISLVSAPMDTAWSVSMSKQIRRWNGPPSNYATRFGSIGCGRIRCGIAWLLLERRIRRRLFRGCSGVGLQKDRQECADGREQ